MKRKQLNPSGLCWCGCEQKTGKVHAKQETQYGVLERGDYSLYRRYHHRFGRNGRKRKT